MRRATGELMDERGRHDTIVCLLWGFTILCVLCVPTAASAEHPAVDTLEQRFDVVVDAPDEWSDADLESLLRGAGALPERMWSDVDGPVKLVRVDQLCLFSMGRYNERCPTFGDDKRIFYIYDEAPLAGEGSVERLEILTGDEQRDIQIRRAVVHLVTAWVDEQHRWSDRRRWQAVNGWIDDDERPLNRDPQGFSRYLGMQSARFDLLTFAEEFFVRPEDLLRERRGTPSADERLEAFSPDDRLVCRHGTRHRVFQDLVAELDSSVERPERPSRAVDDDRRRCPAFERWAEPHELEGVELWFAEADDGLDSLFGHLLLRLDYGDVDRERVYRFGVVTDDDVDIVEYYTRRLLGGFSSVLASESAGGVEDRIRGAETRDIRSYSLQLSDEQKRRLLRRIWEAERRMLVPYHFSARNNAAFVAELLEPAVDLRLSQQGSTLVMPTDVIDTLAGVENGDRGALLSSDYQRIPNLRDRAERAHSTRQNAAERLEKRVDKPDRDQFQAEMDAVEAADPARRRDGYRSLKQRFDALLEDTDGAERDIAAFVVTSRFIEEFFALRARFAAGDVRAEQRRRNDPKTADEKLSLRRKSLRDGGAQSEFEESSPPLDVDEFSDEQRALFEYDDQSERTYDVVDAMHRRFVEYRTVDGEYLEDLRGQLASPTRDTRPSIDPTGRHRIKLAGGYLGSSGQMTGRLFYARQSEQLGVSRRRGFGADVGIGVFELDVALPFDWAKRPDFTQMYWDLTLFRYESLRRTTGPLRRSSRDRFGWRLDATVVHDGRRDLWAGGQLTPSLLIPVLESGDHSRHLVASAGPALRYDVHRGHDFYAGVHLGLSSRFHLHGSHANALRLAIETGQYAGFGPRWHFDVRATAELRQRILRRADHRLVAAPYLEAIRSTRDYRRDAPEDVFDSWEVGLRLEMPF